MIMPYTKIITVIMDGRTKNNPPTFEDRGCLLKTLCLLMLPFLNSYWPGWKSNLLSIIKKTLLDSFLPSKVTFLLTSY